MRGPVLGDSGLEDAGDEASGDLAVGRVLGAEGLFEGRLFDANAVEDCCGWEDEQDGQAGPVAGAQADGEEDNEDAKVGRMPDDAVQACPVHSFATSEWRR